MNFITIYFLILLDLMDIGIQSLAYIKIKKFIMHLSVPKTLLLKNTFYPSLKAPVKNNISLKKNIIITGPNASGKTTLLKCCVLNVLFTQQVGKGFL